MSNIKRYKECAECGEKVPNGKDLCPECGSTETLRHYIDGDVDVLSVTTVLKWLEEDTSGLDIWKGRNDGKGNNADHEHLFWYKTYRGTMCHYSALSIFEDVHDGDMWGPGEREALIKIMDGPRDGEFEDASHSNIDIVYSILRDHGWVYNRQEFNHRHVEHHCTRCGETKDSRSQNCPECGAFMRTRPSTTIMDVHDVDVEWFVETFERVCDAVGVDENSIIAVEQFLVHDEYGYGGQTDMVYEDRDGDVVVVDLKTSSSLRHKHRLQAIAYAKAVEHSAKVPVDSVDRVEVWRLHPDTQTGIIHTNEVPDRYEGAEWYTDEHWLVDKWGDFEYDSVEEQWDQFKRLIDKANGNTDN